MIRNLMLIAGLSLAMAAFGCSSDDGGSGGSAGAGGTAGGGGGGEGGAGGDGTGGAGGDGQMNAPACDNAADMAAGDPDVTACATAAATTNMEYCPAPVGTGDDSSGLATCLSDGGAENTAACLDCWADLSCCTLNECSVLVGGPCAGAPQPGDACDQCVQQNCMPAFAACGDAG